MLVFLCACITSCTAEANEKTMLAKEILLSDNWMLSSSSSLNQGGEMLSTSTATTDSWYPATVPSTVMGVLTANGLYEDLLFGLNYKKADRSPFDVSWWYRTTFKIPALSEGQHVSLQFDGLTYRANIWLNGKQIGSKDEIYGTFCRFNFDITDYLQEENVLAVEIFRARPGEPNMGFVDWNPRPLDENMGIFREVRLNITGNVEMKNTWVRSTINKATLDEAWLNIETELSNLADKEIKGKLEGTIENIHFSVPVTLSAGEKKTIKVTPEDIKALHIKNPRLWWCNNMGQPALYKLNLQFVTGGEVSSKEDVTFGIREIETYLTAQGHKGFLLNGKRVLIKSAGWTDDIFLRDSPETNEIQVQYVKDMNLNSIRFENIWGTSRNIYDLCDRYGLLAMVGWSCQWEWENYFGGPESNFGCIQTEHDKDLVYRYFDDQVHWLRNHPSIIAWLGGSDMLLHPSLEKRYMGLLAKIDNRPYIGSAANNVSEVTGPTGMKMAGPYEYVGPNYWFIDSKYGGNYGFNTETGPGAQVPVYESLLKMMPEEKLWPLNEYWDYHCTTSTTALNNMKPNTEAVEAMFGKTTDLNSYLNRSYLINMQSTKSMFEAFRVNPSEATGIVQWMLNSAWPSMYWQLYDFHLIPVAAYYGVKKANEPYQLIYNYKDNGIYAVNETDKEIKDIAAIIRGYTTDSKLLFEENLTITLEANSVKNIYTIDNSAKNTFLSMIMKDKDNQLADNFYCLSSKEDKYDWDKTIWVGTPMIGYGDFKELTQLPATELKVTIQPLNNKEGITVEIENPSETIALLAQFALCDNNKEIIYPVFWSDNYLSILPGEKKTLTCKYDQSRLNSIPTTLKVSGWNLAEQRIELK